MKAFFRFVLLAMILLIVAMASALTAMRIAIHGREVRVPKLVGLTPVEAERAALQGGVLVEVENRFYSTEVPEGHILSQLPAPGTQVRRGWRVRLAESLGPQRVVIPNVVGQSSRAAEINLRRRGLEPGTVAVAHLGADVPDQVIAQSPPAAAEVSSPKVDLLYAAAPEEQAYVMPNLVGHPLADAVREVTGAGMKVAAVRTVSNGNGAQSANGTTVVVRQAPAAGVKVSAGTKVELDVTR